METPDLNSFAAMLGNNISSELVAAVVSGKIEHNKESGYGFYDVKEEGFCIAFEEMTGGFEEVTAPEFEVTGIHLFGNEIEGHQCYPGKLPNGIQFGDDINKVRRLLDTYITEGGGEISSVGLGLIPKWLEASGKGYRIHYVFSTSGRLTQVTLF